MKRRRQTRHTASRTIRFDIHYRRHWVEITVLPDRVRVKTRAARAAPINVGYKGEVAKMGPGETHEFMLIVSS